MNDTYHADWMEGYRDGQEYHLNGNLDIKGEDPRYADYGAYYRGFTAAGEDS